MIFRTSRETPPDTPLTGSIAFDHPQPTRAWNNYQVPRLTNPLMSPRTYSGSEFSTSTLPSRYEHDFVARGSPTNVAASSDTHHMPGHRQTWYEPGAYHSPTVEDASDHESTQYSPGWSGESEELSTALSTPTSGSEAAVDAEQMFHQYPIHEHAPYVYEGDATSSPPQRRLSSPSYRLSSTYHPSLQQDANRLKKHEDEYRLLPQPFVYHHEQRMNTMHFTTPTTSARMMDLERYERAYIRKLEELCRDEAHMLRGKLRKLRKYERHGQGVLDFFEGAELACRNDHPGHNHLAGRTYGRRGEDRWVSWR